MATGRQDFHTKFLCSRKGFTVIEILVAISITALLSALAITYSKTGERQVSLYVETQKMANVIFRAKSSALGALKDGNPNTCGFGMEIDYSQKTYSLYTYEEPNPPNCASLAAIPSGFRKTISSYTVAPGLVLRNADADSLSVLLFVPPNPKTLLSVDGGASLTGSPVKVYLETNDGQAKRTITINSSGQVDF